VTAGARGDRPTRALAPAELLRGLATGTDAEHADGARDPRAADAGWRRGAAIAVLAVAGAGALATSGRVAIGSGANFGESAAISRVAGRANGSVEAQGDSAVKTRKFGTDALRGAVVAAALTAGATAQDAVQWRVEDGGNGHWYTRNPSHLTWLDASAFASSVGGSLATTTSAQELAFIKGRLLTDGALCWLGGTIDCGAAGGACCAGCTWRWTTGEPFDLTWAGWAGENGYNTERLVTNGVAFDDMCSPCAVQDFRPPSLIEWSADCNSDGIVDYGQIRAGQLPDANANGVPDGCECSSFPELPACRCVGDIVADRIVNGADLGTLLSYWGPRTSGSFSIASDLNDNGTIDGADLGILLSNWGECQPAAVIVPPWATLIEAAPDPAAVTDTPLRTAIAATGLAWRVRDTGTGIEMLLIPPGTFQMGCVMGSDERPCDSTEQPVHSVTLTRPFYMGRYEVTQAQWRSVMGTNPSYFQSSSESVTQAEVFARPVERISWNSVQEFADATGLRLPSEAEWEFACRGGTLTPFFNGTTRDDTLPSLAWIVTNSNGQTRPGGGRTANALGLYDTLGNVWEFTNDGWGAYSGIPQVDPIGPQDAPGCVVRGGCFADGSNGIAPRSSFRRQEPKTWADAYFGFRVARNP
jgi:formylglycine-generating enzyme required for sulfatase activity